MQQRGWGLDGERNLEHEILALATSFARPITRHAPQTSGPQRCLRQASLRQLQKTRYTRNDDDDKRPGMTKGLARANKTRAGCTQPWGLSKHHEASSCERPERGPHAAKSSGGRIPERSNHQARAPVCLHTDALKAQTTPVSVPRPSQGDQHGPLEPEASTKYSSVNSHNSL